MVSILWGLKYMNLRLSCKFTGAKYASAANGTDAISLVLMAWHVGPGDAVFVPSFTYVATAEAPAQLGATPFLLMLMLILSISM